MAGSVVTVAIAREDEHLLRELAAQKFGHKKGALGKIVSEALHALQEKELRAAAFKQLQASMDKGFNIGFKGYKTRNELYE